MPKRRPAFDSLEPRLCLAAPTLQTTFSLPQTGAWTGTIYHPSPLFVDIFGTGKDDLISVAAGARIVAYAEGANGSATPVVTYQAPPLASGQVADIISTPIVVTDPRNGQKDLFAGLGRNTDGTGVLEDGRVFGWNLKTGQLLQGFTNGVSTGTNPGGQSGVYGSLTSGVLGTDGLPDIVATSFSHNVVAITLDGGTLWTWDNDDTIVSGAVIGDIDRTGVNSVVVGGDSSNSPYYQAGGWVNVLSNNGLLKWRQHIPGEVTWSSPVLGDLNNNGYLDIVIGTGLSYDAAGAAGARAAGNYIYAFDPFGGILPGWPYHTTSNDAQAHEVLASPAIVDFTGTGQLDVVAVDRSGYVQAIQPNGQPLPAFVGGRSLAANFAPGTLPDDYGSVVVADVNGDGKPEVIAPYGPFLRGIDANGNITNITTSNTIAPATTNEGLDGAAAIGHFDGGSTYTLAVVSESISAQGRPDQVQILTLPATTYVPAWPMMRRTASGDAVMRSKVFDHAYVVDAFNAALGYLPDAATLANFDNTLDADVINLLQTAEFVNEDDSATAPVRQTEVIRVFMALLGAGPNASALSYFTNYLATNTYRALEIQIASGSAFAQDQGNSRANEVTTLYKALIGRAPSSTELNYWASTNLSTGQLAGVFSGVPEALNHQLAVEFYLFFGASASNNIPPDALASFAYDIHHGAREETIFAGVLASNGQYGAMNYLDDYTRDLYRDILRRQPTSAEVAMWVQGYDSGAASPNLLPGVILNSTEARIDYVQQEFGALLGRAASASEANAFAGYATRESLILVIVGSQEYISKNGGTPSSYVTAVYRDLGGIYPVDQNTINYWLGQYAMGQPLTSTAKALLASTLYDNVTAVNEIFAYLPDETQGVLRTGDQPVTATTQASNPNPALVNYVVGQMQQGVSDEAIISILLTTPAYDQRVTYYKGILRSPGIRN